MLIRAHQARGGTAMQQPSTNRPLTTSLVTRELARLGIFLSEGAVKRAADLGQLPVVRTERGMRLFTLNDVKRFAESRSRAAASRRS